VYPPDDEALWLFDELDEGCRGIDAMEGVSGSGERLDELPAVESLICAHNLADKAVSIVHMIQLARLGHVSERCDSR
jgi:hypothetical protein